jgi:hypothetical protein
MFEDLLPLFKIKRAASRSGSRDLKPSLLITKLHEVVNPNFHRREGIL